MDSVMAYPHGDIKRMKPDGTLIEIIPIEKAMEQSNKEFKKPKPFGQTAIRSARVKKELKQLEKTGELAPPKQPKEKPSE